MPTKSPRPYLLALLLGLIFMISAACQLSAALPTAPTPTRPAAAPAGCENRGDPTEQDVQYALNFPKSALRTPGWQRSYTVENTRTSVTWTDETGGVAYLEYLIWSCGYTQQDLDDYFSDDTLTQVIFQYYSDVRKTDMCSRGKELTLHEFRSNYEGVDYVMRLWVKPVTGTRVLYMMLAFPEESGGALDRVSQAVFPGLMSC